MVLQASHVRELVKVGSGDWEGGEGNTVQQQRSAVITAVGADAG
jgi:hypothetical protein